MKERLFTATSDQRRIAGHLMQIREKLAIWHREHDDLMQTISHYEKELHGAAPPENGDKTEASQRSKVRLLRRLLTAVRERGLGTDENVARKLQSVPMRMALRTVNNSLARMANHESSVATLQQELAEVARLLRKDFQIIISEGIDRGQGPPRVSGLFDPRVKIYADPFLVNDPQPPPGSHLSTPEDLGTPRTYCRQDGYIVEIK